jgi:hypothetical protein
MPDKREENYSISPEKLNKREKITFKECVGLTIKKYEEVTGERLKDTERERLEVLLQLMAEYNPKPLPQSIITFFLRDKKSFKYKKGGEKINYEPYDDDLSYDGTRRRVEKYLEVAITGGGIDFEIKNKSKFYFLTYIIKDSNEFMSSIDLNAINELRKRVELIESVAKGALDDINRLSESKSPSA